MNYHLHHNGQNLGIFPLEELRRKRSSGALTGAEAVWCEGMADWQALDVILQQNAPGTPMPPPVLPTEPKSNRNTIIVVAAVLLFLMVGGVAATLVLKRVARRARSVIRGIEAVANQSSENSSALTAASKPVAVNTNTLTARKVMERSREFRVRQYVEGYQQRGDRNVATDALALGLVENWIACNYGGTVNTNLPSLAELGDKLAGNPACTDPLVLTAAAVNGVELHEAIRRLERAVSGFENSKHLGYPKFYATVTLRGKMINDREDRQPVLDALALKRFKESLTDGSILPGDQAEMAELLVMGWARNFFDWNSTAVIAAVKERGEPFSWLALTLEGEREITEAWRARGSGYADTVSETGWKGFKEHLAKARDRLTKAWKLQPGLPLAPCRMIYVSLGDSDIGEMRQWFDRAVFAQIDYPKAWSDLRWGLRPRWYGDEESMLALGVTAVNTRRFDTDVPRIFFDAVADLEAELKLPAGEHVYGREDVWPHFQEMYEGYLAETKDDAQRGWRSAYSVVAFLAGKQDVARLQLEALNWSPNPWNLTGWKLDLSLMAPEVAARTGTQSQKVEQAEARRRAGNFPAAIKLYSELAAINLEPPAQTFVRERLASLDGERRLQEGKWVSWLPATTNFAGWEVARGQCKMLPGGALEVQSDENGHLLYSRMRIGTEFEVRGQFEVVRSSNPSFQAGLVMGLPQWESQSWYAFRIKRNTDEGDVASFSQHWLKKQILAPLPLDARTNSFLFRLHAGKVSATVNGREVFHDVEPPKNSFVSTNQFLLGLGAFNDSNSTVIRYRNVEARQLPAL